MLADLLGGVIIRGVEPDIEERTIGLIFAHTARTTHAQGMAGVSVVTTYHWHTFGLF